MNNETKEKKIAIIEVIKKAVAVLTAIVTLLGINVSAQIITPYWYKLPFVHRNTYETKVETIRPTQSYEYIENILAVPQSSETFTFLLQNEEEDIGTRKIWANDLFVFIGYFKSDNSLFGYILISQHKKFSPKIGSDFYNEEAMGNLSDTDFIRAHELSDCYIDTAKGFYAPSALTSSYYMELYDFNRSDFCYGLAITNLGENFDDQIDENFYEVNNLPYFKMAETTDVENPLDNILFESYRKLYPNAMMMFDNRSNIDMTEFMNRITDCMFAISYSDLRRLY